jgi:hypothetical protein
LEGVSVVPSNSIKIKELLVQGNKGQSTQTNTQMLGVKYQTPVLIDTGKTDPNRVENVIALIEAIASHTQTNHEMGQITRAITDEFSFYPEETPFTLAEYKQIINKTALIARKLTPDVHLILATFPVLWPDGGIHNCGLYVQSPKHADEAPTLHHFSKKNHSELDINYQKLDGTLYPLTADQNCIDEQRPNILLNDTSVATHDINQYDSAIKIITSDSKEFISTVGICLDHAIGTERTDVHALIDKLQAANASVPLHCSHVITSATIEEKSENVLSTISHADPSPSSRKPAHYPNRSGYKPSSIQSTFSGTLDVEIYPTKQIGTLHGDLFQHIAANMPAKQFAAKLNTPDANGDTLLHQVFAETDYDPELIAKRLYSMVLNGGDPDITNNDDISVRDLAADHDQESWPEASQPTSSPQHQIMNQAPSSAQQIPSEESQESQEEGSIDKESFSEDSNFIITHAINSALAWKKHVDFQNSISLKDKRTPLTRTLIKNKPSVAQFRRLYELILMGANPYVKDGYGLSAMAVADSYKLYFDRELTKIELKVSFEQTRSGHCADAHAQDARKTAWYTTEPPTKLTQINCDEIFQDNPNLSIYNAENFYDVMSNLSIPQRTYLFEEMKEQLPGFISSAPYLYLILVYLTPAQRAFVFDVSSKNLPDLIYNTQTFRNVFKFLSLEQSALIFEQLDYEWTAFIRSENDIRNVLKYLPLPQANVVIQALKRQLPDSIHSTETFQTAMKFLSPQKRSLMSELLKTQLPTFIRSSNDFCNIAKYLSSSQIEFIFQEIKTRLITIIDSAEDCCTIFSHLDQEHCSLVLCAITDKLPEFIQSTWDLYVIFTHLDEEQCTFVYEKINSKLPDLIRTSFDLQKILLHISPQKRNVLLDTMSSKLPTLILSIDDYFKILNTLTTEKYPLISESMLKKLPLLLRSHIDFLNILNHLTSDQIKPICDASLPRIIYSIQNYTDLLQNLPPKQHPVVFDTMKERLSGLIYTNKQFYLLMRCLNTSQRAFVFEQIKARAPILIHSAKEFNSFVKYLSPQQRTHIFKTMIKQLPDYIKSKHDVADITYYFTMTERPSMIDALRAQHATKHNSSFKPIRAKLEHIPEDQKNAEAPHGYPMHL